MKTKKSVVWAVCSCVTAIFLLASPAEAQRRRGSAESEAILPQIDVVKVKESADEALRAVNDLRREVATLNARLTEQDNRLLLLSEEVSRVSAAKIEEVETRLALLTEAYKDMFVLLQALETHVRPAPRAAAPRPSASTFTTTASGDLILSSPEYDLYMSGLRLFNARSYDRALAAFNDCLAKFPDGEFRDRASFWTGETHYQMGNMELAIEAYRRVLTHRNSPKADAAQFQIAMAHQKLGQAAQARAEFRRLIERFPASAFAERARRNLENLR
jgi:tol-pal system protein YbgF